MSSKNKTTAMAEEEKPVWKPELRFPEFRGAEGWRKKLIGPYLEDCSGRVPPDTELPVYSSTREGLKRQDAYFDGRVLQNKNEYGMVPPGCFVYRHMSDDGLFKFNINETGGEIAVSKEYPVFRTKGLNPDFLLAKLNEGLDFKHFALSQKAGGTRTRLYFSRLCEWCTLLPSPAEQQKIADCLNSVDERIAAQARKVDALKTHKKGLMQQLFPREGETQPRLRLPEFHNAGEWKMTTIGDLKPFITSGSRGWAPFYAEQGELFIRITNLWRDSIYLDLKDSKFVQLPPGSNEGVRTQLKEHDVLISITADIGIIGYVDESVPSPAYINQHIALVRFDTEQLCGKYVAYFLASDKSQRLFRASTDTGTKAGMSLIGIQKIKLMLPGLPEQQRIASCLSSLDALITAETQQLEALKTHKKGLMQQLFPSTDEVAA